MSIQVVKPFTAFEFIRPFLKKYVLRIACGLIALLGVDLLQLMIPRVIKSAVDGLQRGSFPGGHGLLNHALLIVLLAVGVAVCRFFWRYLILGFSRLLEEEIRNALVDKLLRLDRAFFQRQTTGELMALATNDLASVQLACGMGLVSFVDAIVITLAVIGFMLYISPLLTVITLAPLPLLAILTRKLSGKLHHRFKLVQEQFSKLTEQARSVISSMRLVKVYTQEDAQANLFQTMGQTYINQSLNVAKIQGVLFPISGLIANFSLLLVVVVGGRLAIDKQISLGDFVAFISYLLMMTWPMMAIGWVANLFQRGVTSLGRIQSALNDQPLLVDHPAALPIDPPIQTLSISLNSFTYPGQNRPVLHDLQLDFEYGVYGIVGKTGSGKSTLCQILARMFPVADSSIFINGRDLNRITTNSYRQCIAYVPQDPLLFSNTIAYNIAFGRPEATPEEIEAAARQAGIHQEILRFTEGYETKIGERGVKLSGGQRQRLSLARAFLTKAPIILIDDGLSAVDSGTEQIIVESLNAFARQAMVIIVSHRLSPLSNAKNIAVLDDGRLVAIGNHQTLMQSSSYYQAIYSNQSDTAGFTGQH